MRLLLGALTESSAGEVSKFMVAVLSFAIMIRLNAFLLKNALSPKFFIFYKLKFSARKLISDLLINLYSAKCGFFISNP